MQILAQILLKEGLKEIAKAVAIAGGSTLLVELAKWAVEELKGKKKPSIPKTKRNKKCRRSSKQ